MGSELDQLRRQNEALQSRLAHAEARLQAALAWTDEGLVMIDAQGLIVAVNDRFNQLWRVPPDTAATWLTRPSIRQGTLLPELVLEQLRDPDAFATGIDRVGSSDDALGGVVHLRDGRVFSYCTRVRPIRSVACPTAVIHRSWP